jgi:hypothetical protein
MNVTDTLCSAVSSTEYQEALTQLGLKCHRSSSDDFWMVHEMGSMMRVPTFRIVPPPIRNLDALFWKLRAPAVSYLIEPDAERKANAWLYLCESGGYSPGELSSVARRDLRRAQRSFRFELVSWESLLKHGGEAFGDTRRRVGLSDGTAEAFRSHYSTMAKISGQCIAGAWIGETLAAFLSLIVVDRWVEVQGAFSANRFLSLCPNDGLYAFVLEEYLIRRGFEVVHSGLSSSQQTDNAAGLHRFKLKVGFKARPVHRVFVLHPLIRPFVNRLTLSAIEAFQRMRPKDRRIRKAAGMLNTLLNPREPGGVDGDVHDPSSATS